MIKLTVQDEHVAWSVMEEIISLTFVVLERVSFRKVISVTEDEK